MPAICLIFQVHQPYRLKYYPFDKIGKDHSWEDVAANIARLNRMADFCYLPANEALLKAIRKADGRLKAAFSISGVCLEQLFRYRPDVLDSFRKLSESGCVEFLAETYYHSLAALYSETEFRRQVVKQEKAIQNLLDVRPTVLRNTELLFSDTILPAVEALGYPTMLAEWIPACSEDTHPNQVFNSARKTIQIMARNPELSEEIAFSFEQLSREPGGAAAAFAKKVDALGTQPGCIAISLNYETFGGHFPRETGIIDFLEKMPADLLENRENSFLLPSDACDGIPEKPVFTSEAWSSWGGKSRNALPWTGNHLQRDALSQLYSLENSLYKSGKPELLDQWGRLQSSDHFFDMNTRYASDGAQWTSQPSSSPYDAYLNYMNVLSDFRKTLEHP